MLTQLVGVFVDFVDFFQITHGDVSKDALIVMAALFVAALNFFGGMTDVSVCDLVAVMAVNGGSKPIRIRRADED